ncbi:MAG: hypothetical protein JO336_08800 [Acidobacteriia bacterium]|nr:hypothetical protein [Terriglobia bacterium]MBV8907098.1 hypothetical protein [Terriglobia bacterium]
MPVLSIKQVEGCEAKVEFEGGEWEVEVHNPFTPEQEEELRWYFENHLEWPMLETVRAERAANSIRDYGAELFEQLFKEPELLAAFRKYRTDQIRVELSGAPEFHGIHWEALWDSKQPNPLAYRAVVTRRVHKKGAAKIQLQAEATIRVLVVVARPGGGEDVGYRTI